MSSVAKPGFYHNGRFLGQDVSSAMQRLSEDEIYRVASEYSLDARMNEELYGGPIKDPIRPTDRQLATLALERIGERAAEILRNPGLMPFSYGDVGWRFVQDRIYIRMKRPGASGTKPSVVGRS